jgi:lysophospholipase L1-like esterase
MNLKTRRLIATWIVGSIAGTVVVAITSPLFVRSYVPLHIDSLRGVWTYDEGHRFRWRSEGYATTWIGPHGMPGRTELPPDSPETTRVALWGDSQAEGVCVPDHQKLFAQAERIARAAGRPITFLPLARSGEDVAHWLTQFRSLERRLGVDLHILVIVDLPDLLSASNAPLQFSDTGTVLNRSTIASSIPAFLIQAVRYLVTDADDNPRRLRFSVGPVESEPVGRFVTEQEIDWTDVCRAIRATTDRPVVILYAPNSPHLAAGKIVLPDPHSKQFERMKQAAESEGLAVVDMSEPFRESALDNGWPHGFHNGQIGSGHLNGVGYQVIAGRLVPTIARTIEGKD